jgi:hypothetical protein
MTFARWTLGMAALLATAGAAMADGPMVLTDAQLDRVTAGQYFGPLLIVSQQDPGGPPDSLVIVFHAGHPAQPPGSVRFSADPGFELSPPTPAPNLR